MWYYIKDNKKIGPVTSERLLALYKCGIISTDTMIRNKSGKSGSWKQFSEHCDEVMKNRGMRDHVPNVFFGLSKQTKIFRAVLTSIIVVLGVSIYYTLENFRLLQLFLDGAISITDDNFKIEIMTMSNILALINNMLLIMLIVGLLMCIKWIKLAYLTCYSLSKQFQTIFPSNVGYYWFLFQPFRMMRKIYASAYESLKRRITLGDKICLFSLQTISIIYVIILFINNFMIAKAQFNISNAQNLYYYLIYTSCVGICAVSLWIICISKIYYFLKRKIFRNKFARRIRA